jgi:uncharacterized protein YceH (UPF0502 family)
MIQLNPNEARVLGVLIEKSLTTPDGYPLSLNAVTNGANQKSNRHPVLNLTEDDCFDALESLREKQLVHRVDQANSRVHKYKHTAGETLAARTGEVAVLAELLLRGPQTLGELRGRASRMAPFETIERVVEMIRALTERSEPLVRELPAPPGSRAQLYAQLLCPDAHDVPASRAESAAHDSVDSDRLERLEQEVRELRTEVARLARAIGDRDPVAAATESSG